MPLVQRVIQPTDLVRSPLHEALKVRGQGWGYYSLESNGGEGGVFYHPGTEVHNLSICLALIAASSHSFNFTYNATLSG